MTHPHTTPRDIERVAVAIELQSARASEPGSPSTAVDHHGQRRGSALAGGASSWASAVRDGACS
jgi:hypothetical protein